jgi:hypothetical protein
MKSWERDGTWLIMNAEAASAGQPDSRVRGLSGRPGGEQLQLIFRR